MRTWSFLLFTILAIFSAAVPAQEVIARSVPDQEPEPGFGMVIAWGLLGNGVYRLRTFIDGTRIPDVEFEVVAIGDGFVSGLDGSCTLEGFPANGQSVDLEWVEADQNFRIARHGE